MTVEQRLERDLPAILGDLAMGPYPDYVEPFLVAAAQRRQRPARTFPERWLPMDIATRRVAAPGLPWRQLGLLALIALIVASAVAVYVGSQRRSPSPFGLAANGLIADATAGDIRMVDPVTGNVDVIVSGPEYDTAPVFSRSGAWLAFLRADSQATLDQPQLYAVRPDGSDLTLLTPEPLTGLGWFEFTVDDDAVMFQAEIDGRSRISLASTDGSGVKTFQDVDVAIDGGLAVRPPDGRVVLFKTVPGFDGSLGGISALDLDTGLVAPIIPSLPDVGVFSDIVWSPTGERFAYAQSHRRAEIVLHVANADGSDDHVVGHRDGAGFEAWPLWSPDGRSLLFDRRMGTDAVDSTNPFQAVILDVETGTEVVVQTPISQHGAAREWAPDGSTILVVRTDENGADLPAELWDISTGAVTPVPWGSLGAAFSWQRTAP